MPMPDTGYIAVLVAVSAAVTWALRALPFAVLAPMRHSAVVRYLSLHMPLGVMVMLALYTVRDIPEAAGRQQLWLVTGGAGDGRSAGVAAACAAVDLRGHRNLMWR